MFRAARFSALFFLAAAGAAQAVSEPEFLAPDTPAIENADTDFPRPAILAPNIAFWTEVFSQYSEYQSVIHSQDDAGRVYMVLDFRDDVVRAGPVEARRIQNKTEKAVKKELDQHLKRVQALQAHPEQLSPIEQRVYEMFADSSDP